MSPIRRTTVPSLSLLALTAGLLLAGGCATTGAPGPAAAEAPPPAPPPPPVEAPESPANLYTGDLWRVHLTPRQEVELARAMDPLTMPIGHRRDLETILRATDDASEPERRLLASRLVRQGPPAVPVLVEVGPSGSWSRRMVTAQCLGEIGDRAGLDAVVALSHDPDWRVRSAAMSACGPLRGPSDRLVAGILDPSPVVRSHAREGWMRQGSSRVADELIQVLRTGTPLERKYAAEALQQAAATSEPGLDADAWEEFLAHRGSIFRRSPRQSRFDFLGLFRDLPETDRP